MENGVLWGFWVFGVASSWCFFFQIMWVMSMEMSDLRVTSKMKKAYFEKSGIFELMVVVGL